MMFLFGVEIRTWNGIPGPFLVVTTAGEGYWAGSFDAARALASDLEADVGNPAQVFSVKYVAEARTE